MAEFYFTQYLTENEHYFVEDMILEYCNKHNLQVKYYRKFKTGHIPCQRECKIIGEQKDINIFKNHFTKEIVFENYWTDDKYKEERDFINLVYGKL